MISVSNNFKNAMKAPVKTVGARVKVVDGDEYSSADYLMKLDVAASGYFFGVATKAITMTMLGTYYNLVDRYVDISLEVLTDSSNNTWETCVLGRFKITEQTANFEAGTTTFKAYDAIGIMGNKLYADNRMNFPCTVNDLAVQLASASNIDYDETSLINGTYSITEDLYSNISGTSLRDVLAEVAGASSSLAAVHGVNSLLTFTTPPQTAAETLTYDNLKTLKIEPKYGDVNTVVLSRAPQEDNVVAYPHAEATGTSMVIPDAGDTLKELERVYGDTEQPTTTGKNLFTSANIQSGSGTLYAKDDNEFTLSITKTSGSPTVFREVPFTLSPNTTYTLKALKSITGTTFNKTGGIRLNKENAWTDTWDSDGVMTFTTGNTGAIKFGVYLYWNAGTATGDVSVRWYQVQLEKSSSATSFEPYTGGAKSPSVQYPQPVKTVTGRVLVTATSKNFLSFTPATGTNLNGLTSAYNSTTGVITITGTSTTNWSNVSTRFYVDKPAGTYTLSTGSTSSKHTKALRIYLEDGTYIDRIININATKITFTTTKRIASFYVYLAGFSSNTSFNESFTLQLESGSTATEFEKFGGSQVYELNLGKNLFDKSSVVAGAVLTDGTFDPSYTDARTSVYIQVEPYTTYTISGRPGGWGVQAQYKADKTFIGRASGSTFTTPGNCHWVRVMCYASDLGTVQLEKGSASSTYAAYFEPIKLFDTSGSRDYIFPQGDDWFIHKEIGEGTLDGSEWWGEASGTYFTTKISDYATSGNIPLSRYYEGVSNVAGAGSCPTGKIAFINRISDLRFYIRDTASFPTVTDLTTWLTNNNMVVNYVLGTPTNTKITNTALISQLNAIRSAALYGNKTEISVSSLNLIPEITVDYWENRDNLCEVKLANNEILDDNREELIEPIRNTVNGFGFYPFTATTEGHGWYEVGDRLGIVTKRNIPEEYQQVEYLKSSTGTCYINTGFTGTNQNTSFAIDYKLNGFVQNFDFPYGTRVQNTKQAQIYHQQSNTRVISQRYNTAQQDVYYSAGDDVYNRHLYEQKKNEIYIDGELRATMAAQTFTNTYPVFVFATNAAGSVSAKCKMTLYSFKIWDDGKLVRDMIPCYRKTDNKPGLYDAVNGGFYANAANVADDFVVGSDVADETTEVVITDIKLTIDGGIKETISGVAPTESTTNYALAGGITKSIYNTEIKVDKQGQEITSIVSRQDQFEDQTLENFSQVVQNISSVVTTIQTTGGGNLIHNSVGYNKEPNSSNLANWTSTGTVTAVSSPESVSYGAISGNQVNFAASSSITQRIAVDASGGLYTLSFKAKKSATGSATVSLTNSVDNYSVTIPNGESVLWEDFDIAGVTPHDSYFDVVISTNASATDFSITDLILTVGNSRTPWVSASDEILSTHVAVDSGGVKVSSNATNDYVKLDELGLNGYSDASGALQNVFTINRDLTEVEKLKTRTQLEMPPLKVVPITGSVSGWGWVKNQ